ncbi:MAG: hypothetical protein OXF00_11205 [bacterium]|nr:hypothetical protein [bacterium]
MSDAIAFLLILPALLLGVAVLDAAGTLGTARYRTSTFAEAAAANAAAALADSAPVGADPSARSRWDEASAVVKQSGLAATAGVCGQADPGFDVRLLSQPRNSGVAGAPPSAAVVVICPVDLGPLLTTKQTAAVGIEPVG